MLQLVKNTDDYIVVTHNTKLIFLVWKKRILAEALDDIRGVQKFLYTANGDKKLFMFTITLKNVDIPKDDAILAISTWLNENSKEFYASAVLHYDTGWRASIVKTITWALAKSSNYPIPHQPFFSYRAALKWFVTDFPEGELDFADVVDDTETLLTAIVNEQSSEHGTPE